MERVKKEEAGLEAVHVDEDVLRTTTHRARDHHWGVNRSFETNRATATLLLLKRETNPNWSMMLMLASGLFVPSWA